MTALPTRDGCTRRSSSAYDQQPALVNKVNSPLLGRAWQKPVATARLDTGYMPIEYFIDFAVIQLN